MKKVIFILKSFYDVLNEIDNSGFKKLNKTPLGNRLFICFD